MSRPNIWIMLLLASVLLNGVLLGAAARNWFAPADGPQLLMEGASPAGRRSFDVRGFFAALPPQARPEVRRRFEAAGPDLRGLAREAVRTRAAAMRLLSEPDFDPDAARAALAEARSARAELEATTEQVILDSVADLEPADRQAALRAALGPDRLRGPGRGGRELQR